MSPRASTKARRPSKLKDSRCIRSPAGRGHLAYAIGHSGHHGAPRRSFARIKPDIAHHSGLQCCVYGSIAALGRKFPSVSALDRNGLRLTSATWRTLLAPKTPENGCCLLPLESAGRRCAASKTLTIACWRLVDLRIDGVENSSDPGLGRRHRCLATFARTRRVDHPWLRRTFADG